MAFVIGLPTLIITVIMLGATVYSIKHEEQPLLLKPKYKKKH